MKDEKQSTSIILNTIIYRIYSTIHVSLQYHGNVQIFNTGQQCVKHRKKIVNK